MTFKEYMFKRRTSMDTTGDLARIVSARGFPDVQTLAELKTSIIASYGEGPLSDAAGTLWRGYEVAQKKARPTKPTD
jgi:hypothetical protein